MKKLIVLLTICILISGCGLFRKKTIIRDSAVFEHESIVTQLKKDRLNLIEKEAQKAISFTDDKTKITLQVKGSLVEMTSNGFNCKDCEVIQSQKNDIKNLIDSSSFQESNIEYFKEASILANKSSKDERKYSKTVNKPEGSSFIWFSLAVILFTVGIFYILRK